ncbi:MAG TPA: MFS transporter [Candidatus Megaira endosymbiont of Nemacystus decipiens]|nr:MFS transporter [Candidatus Megaera endosymbiont of Nemacystus decipiens]
MNKKNLIFIGGVANAFEWYDYALFGHFVSIISTKFFPATDSKAALLQTFSVFAVGYLVRPLGGIFFGVIGDKFGRKKALSSAIICMAIPTTIMGILPTYDSVGIISTILMVVVRILQGLSMGGALTGSVSFIIEHTDKSNRGLISSISMSSICIGMLLGSLSSFLVRSIFSEEFFYNYAWRFPFILGVGVFFVGQYIKNYAQETPLFEETKYLGELEKNPLKKAISKHWFQMLISIFINATGSIIFYMEAIYIASYLKITRGFSEFYVDCLINFCYLMMIFVTIFAGWLSDKIERRKIFIINIIFIILTMPYLLEIFENGNFAAVVFAQIMIALIAAFYIGPEPALQAESYKTSVRNTALSVSYNTATSLFGGTAPYIVESMLQNTGTITSAVYYISFVSALSLIALCFYRDNSINTQRIKASG